MGNDNYFKQSVALATGLSETGWSSTLAFTKTTGNGFVDGTEFEAYSYFFNLTKQISTKQMLSFTLFGTPQEHNQRRTMLPIKTFKEKGIKYNQDWGYKHGDKYNLFQNFYHKPQAFLNHFYTFSDKLKFNTVLYASFGQGGGRGDYGEKDNKFDDYRKDGQIDFNRIINENIANGNKGSDAIIRNSINNHYWCGVLFAPSYEYRNLTITGGIDARYYLGQHYREVEDLLGGQFLIDDSENDIKKVRKIGDKIGYHNDGEVLWEGLFGQVEYDLDKLSAFISIAASNKSYKRIDYFNYTKEEGQETKWVNFQGFSAKGGINYNVDDYNNVFFNIGFFSRQPDFRTTFLNYQNITNDNAKNEKSF